MIGKAISFLLLSLIQAYRMLLSPMLGPCCRHVPSCSEYAIGAIQIHGPLRGSWLTLRRLCRCHPFHPSCVDPVPQGEQRGS